TVRAGSAGHPTDVEFDIRYRHLGVLKRVAGFVDGGANGCLIEVGRAGDGDDGCTADVELHGHRLHAIEGAELFGDAGNAVATGHPGHAEVGSDVGHDCPLLSDLLVYLGTDEAGDGSGCLGDLLFGDGTALSRCLGDA